MIMMGSAALALQTDLKRKLNDYDFLSTEEEYNHWLKENEENIEKIIPTKFGFAVILYNQIPFEFEIVEKNPSSKILHDLYNGSLFLPLDALYTLKMSHRFLKNSPHFLKTMLDIYYMRSLGAKVPYELSDWMKIREKETYNYSHPNLNRDKVSFFENIQKGYNQQNYLQVDHDDIHEAIKLYDKPAYEYFKDPNHPVRCLKSLFDDLPYSLKLASVYEEAAVLAIERSHIPNGFKYDARKVFEYALTKVCTSITSGWWREFAWENYFEALKLLDNVGSFTYINKYKEAEQQGKIKEWKEFKEAS